jgi:hypothetical protein
VRNYISSGSRAAIFYFPLGPVFDLSLFRALLFSTTSSLCLYYFLLYEALRFRARARGHGGREIHYGLDWRCGTLLGQAHSWAN